MKTVKERFLENVVLIPFHTCQEWVGGKFNDGYGSFYMNKKNYRAHRASWEITNGAIPREMQVLHRCDNPGCVNPKHLFLGTQDDNIKDMVIKKRGRSHTLKGEACTTAKLTQRQVNEIRLQYKNGGITCKQLGNKYGVSEGNIGLIINNKTWVVGV